MKHCETFTCHHGCACLLTSEIPTLPQRHNAAQGLRRDKLPSSVATPLLGYQLSCRRSGSTWHQYCGWQWLDKWNGTLCRYVWYMCGSCCLLPASMQLLQYCVWTAAMFFFFTSCFTITSPCRLPSLCMTPEDDIWSSITHQQIAHKLFNFLTYLRGCK